VKDHERAKRGSAPKDPAPVRPPPTSRPPAVPLLWTAAMRGATSPAPVGGAPAQIRLQRAEPCACGRSACASCGARAPTAESSTSTGQGAILRGPAVPSAVAPVLSSPGRPLEPALREELSDRFGHDFGGVRIHADSPAAEAARSLRAHAFTVGDHIGFARGRFAPGTPSGLRTLAHELAHVVQQDGAAGPARDGLEIGARDAPQEREADRAADAVARGDTARPTGGAPAAVALQADDEGGGVKVLLIRVSLTSGTIDFLNSDGSRHRYGLVSDQDLLQGTFTATVQTKGRSEVHLTLPKEAAGAGKFQWRIRQGQPNPATLLAGQNTVEIEITDKPAPELEPTPPAPEQAGPEVVSLTPEEAQRRCEAGDLPGIMVFPMRLTRLNAAPIQASRHGDKILVKQPNHVFTNDLFHRQTRTLIKHGVFTGGALLEPNQLVRVRIYSGKNLLDPENEEQNEICVTGADMLELGSVSNTATLINIGVTALEALPFAPGVGAALGRVTSRLVNEAGRRLLVPTLAATVRATEPLLPGTLAGAPGAIAAEQAAAQVTARAGTRAVTEAVSEVSARGVGETVAEGTTQAATRLAPSVAPQVAGTAGVVAVAETAGATAQDLATQAAIQQGLPSPTPVAAPLTPARQIPAPRAPVAGMGPAPPVTITANVIHNSLIPAQVAQVAAVQARLSRIAAQAVQDVDAGLGTGAFARLLARIPRTSPRYSAVRGSAIHERAFQLIQAARGSGGLPRAVLTDRGRAETALGFTHAFTGRRPDIRVGLGGGEEAIWDITAQASINHVPASYFQPWVRYVTELLY